MGCLNENEVVEFFLPGRTPALSQRVDSHTAGCERCRQLLADYAQMSVGTATTQAGHLGAGLSSSIAPGALTDDPRVDIVQRLAQAQVLKYIGVTLKGKWVIEELIGSGGMAHVFAARHRNGRRFAIKCMRSELLIDPSMVKRFLREGYVANRLDHPGAVAILDDDIMEDGTPFVVMELLEGQTLRQRLARGPLALRDTVPIILQVLNVLAAAHPKGIVHRDLKPDNLFETSEGVIKVLDFGIARLKEHTRPDFETRSGTTMGTIGYMAPEQARGLTAEVDARSDVWAIGATMYTLLTGKSLHEAPTTNQGLLLAMTMPVPPMRTLLPALPPAMQSWLDTALSFDKERRYPSAVAMRDALAAAFGSGTELAAAPKRSRALAWGLGIAAVVAIGSGVGARRGWHRAEIAPAPEAPVPAATPAPPIEAEAGVPSTTPSALPASSGAPAPPHTHTSRPHSAAPRPSARPVEPAPEPSLDPLGPRH